MVTLESIRAQWRVIRRYDLQMRRLREMMQTYRVAHTPAARRRGRENETMTTDPGIADSLAYAVDEVTRLRAALAAAEAERDALRDALIRWIAADETPGFIDADQDLAELARSLRDAAKGPQS